MFCIELGYEGNTIILESTRVAFFTIAGIYWSISFISNSPIHSLMTSVTRYLTLIRIIGYCIQKFVEEGAMIKRQSSELVLFLIIFYSTQTHILSVIVQTEDMSWLRFLNIVTFILWKYHGDLKSNNWSTGVDY